ncbi:MAG: LOG family protein [Leptospirillia bacterium]
MADKKTEPESSRIWENLTARLMDLKSAPNADLMRGMVKTLLHMIERGADRRDLKMAHLALRESSKAMSVFAPYRHVPKVSVFGSARTAPEAASYQMAKQFAHDIVQRGFMVMTGAGGGIMEAAQAGAGPGNSFGLNIELPFEQHANAYIKNDPKLTEFRFFFTRKLFFLKETRALALFPGGFGTLDEGFEALTLIQTGKSTPMPIVMLESETSSYWEEWRAHVKSHLLARGLISEDDLTLFRICHNVTEAVDEITGFFKVFHSSYRTRDGVTIWLWRPLVRKEIELLNDTFLDLLGPGGIVQAYVPKPQLSDSEMDTLSCIEVSMDHRHQGRLRQLIDAINKL